MKILKKNIHTNNNDNMSCSRVFESVHLVANRVELRDRLIATPFGVARSLHEIVPRTHILAALHDSFLVYLKEHGNNNNNKSIYIAPNQSRLLSGALQNMAN